MNLEIKGKEISNCNIFMGFTCNKLLYFTIKLVSESNN